MKNKKKKLANGGILIEPATMIAFKEKQPGHYVGYAISGKKKMNRYKNKDHDLVIKPREQ
jgi:hypothetical protein